MDPVGYELSWTGCKSMYQLIIFLRFPCWSVATGDSSIFPRGIKMLGHLRSCPDAFFLAFFFACFCLLVFHVGWSILVVKTYIVAISYNIIYIYEYIIHIYMYIYVFGLLDTLVNQFLCSFCCSKIFCKRLRCESWSYAAPIRGVYGTGRSPWLGGLRGHWMIGLDLEFFWELRWKIYSAILLMVQKSCAHQWR